MAMKLNLKNQNANQPPTEYRRQVGGAGNSNSRVANLKRLKQRQFGDYCFDYIVQCKHNLSADVSISYQACPLCKLTQQVTRIFFERERVQREKARLESNIARSKLRRQLIYMWSICQPSFYPSQIQQDPFYEIVWSDHLIEVLNQNQDLFDKWFESNNSMIIKGQSSSAGGITPVKKSLGLDFNNMIRIIERRIRINDVGHIAATYIQARVRRFLTQIRVRYMLLTRFEYIPESKSRGEIFYDSLKQRKWQKLPHLLSNDRPATPRTIRRRINFENQIKDKRLEKYKDFLRSTRQNNNTDSDGLQRVKVEPIKETIEEWWKQEEELVNIYEYLVILRDLISLYIHTIRTAGHTGPIWVMPSAPGLHSRALGLSIALQTLPSPAISPQAVPPPNPVIAVKTKPKGSTSNDATNKSNARLTEAAKARKSGSSSSSSPTISTPMLLRALFLLEQAARDSLCVTTPEEAVSILIRSPELRGVYESVAHITYDGDDDVWDGSLGFQPFVQPSPADPESGAAASTESAMSLRNSAAAADIVSSPWSNAIKDFGDEDAPRPVSLMPYGIQLRPMNSAYQNTPSDGNTTTPITYSKASAGQFFRLFYMDEELLGICPSASWVFYPEVHRYRDNIFNGIRKFASSNTTRQLIHQQYQHHHHYRQKLLQRRQQIVQLRRRLRRLIALQQAQSVFGRDNLQTEQMVIASPNALAAAVANITGQKQHSFGTAGQGRNPPPSTNTNRSNVSNSKKSSSKDKAPALHSSSRTGHSPATAVSVFAPIPEMIFPSYIDMNHDTYVSAPSLSQQIFALDRHRINYLQETYGSMAFLRKYPVFQEKLRRTQISNNRAAATTKGKSAASAASGSTESTSTSSAAPAVSPTAASTANASATAAATGAKNATAKYGLVVHHQWKDSHAGVASPPPSTTNDPSSSASRDPGNQSSSSKVRASGKKETTSAQGVAAASALESNVHPVKSAFSSALSTMHSATPSTNYHLDTDNKPSPLLVGSDVFRLLSIIPGNQLPGSTAPLTAASSSSSSAPTQQPAAASAAASSSTAESAPATEQPSMQFRCTEEYLKRLYEYSVNVHTCIRDRLEEVSSFVRLPEDDIGEVGIPMPVLPSTLPTQHQQQHPRPDIDTYMQKLDVEIARLESEAVFALDNIELKAIEQNQGVLSDTARQQKEEREARLVAAHQKMKAGLGAKNAFDNEDVMEDQQEEEEYELMFPVPTLLVIEVYAHLPARPAQPTGAGAINGARRNGISIALPPANMLAAMAAAPETNTTNNPEDSSSIAEGTEDNSSIASGTDSRGSISVNSATLAARKRNSMYGFVDPSAGFTPTVSIHQILGMYSCDDNVKNPEQLDCGLFQFEHFRAIHREKQQVLLQQQQQQLAQRRGSSRGGLNRQQSSLLKQASANPPVDKASANAVNAPKGAAAAPPSLLTPPAHLTIDNIYWARDVNASSGVVFGQVLSQPTHKMECQFLYLAQAPSRDYLDKTLPRKIKLWLGIAAPDKIVHT